MQEDPCTKGQLSLLTESTCRGPPTTPLLPPCCHFPYHNTSSGASLFCDYNIVIQKIPIYRYYFGKLCINSNFLFLCQDFPGKNLPFFFFFPADSLLAATRINKTSIIIITTKKGYKIFMSFISPAIVKHKKLLFEPKWNMKDLMSAFWGVGLA